MAYLTEKEFLNRFEYYTVQLEKLLLEGEDFNTVSGQISFPVHLNDQKTLEVVTTNKAHENLTKYSLEEIHRNGREFLENFVEPENLAKLSVQLPAFYSKEGLYQTNIFIQYCKLKSPLYYSPIFTFTKSTTLPEGVVLSLSIQPKNLDEMSKKMEQVIEMDQFKLNNFKRFQTLTARELEILELLIYGQDNPRIANQLFISRQTVETHRKHIKRKLNIHSYKDLMKYAIAFGLVNI